MNDRQTRSLYTDTGGRPTGKWLAITAVLVLYSLFCLFLAFYLPQYASLAPETMPSEETAEPVPAVAPDFASMDVIAERKAAFVEFLAPLVEEQNQEVLRKRDRILAVKDELQELGEVHGESRRYITRLVEEYRFEDQKLSLPEQVDKLLRRVDKIPASMVLAQAATESAWGTSRFATGGNNFFGQWCFRKGCGSVPLMRGEGQLHEVAAFGSARDSIRSYFRNINTHRAYRGVRQMRAAMREAGEDITGLELIKGLGRYSERGEDYIRELRLIIAGNKFMELDYPRGDDEAKPSED